MKKIGGEAKTNKKNMITSEANKEYYPHQIKAYK
jgi:hypothetical protein